MGKYKDGTTDVFARTTNPKINQKMVDFFVVMLK